LKFSALTALSFVIPSRHDVSMKPIPQRWTKLISIGVIWIAGNVMGNISAEGVHGVLSWTLFVVALGVIPICTFLLLRDDGKPNG
jgi:hypothetical protein